jgi:hypothetical protein
VFGFSWDPFGDNKTAVRGSYRISYDHIFTRTIDNIESSQPGMQVLGITRGNDMINDASLGLFNADGDPRAPRLSDLTITPLFGTADYGLGGETGSANGTLNLGQYIDPTLDTLPLEPTGNDRLSLSPDDFELNVRNPYSQTWSFGIQHEIMENTVLEARYVGRKGTRLYTGLPANQFRLPSGWIEALQGVQSLLQMTNSEAYGMAGVPLNGADPDDLVTMQDLYGTASRSATDISDWTAGPLASLAPTALNSLFLATTNDFMDDILEFFEDVSLGDIIGEIDLASGSSQVHNTSFLESAGLVPLSPNSGNMPLILGLRENEFRPSPQYLNGPDLFSNKASSTYHSLQLSVNRRFSQGLQFQANYTFAKNIDLPFSSFATGNSYNNFFETAVEKSLSGNDLTHDFKFNGIWELPYGHGRRWGSGISGWVNQLLGGWQLSGIASIAGDFPFTVSMSGLDSSYQGGSRPDFAPGVVVDNAMVKYGEVGRDDQGEVVYFDSSFISNFQQPMLGTIGNIPRNWLRGPGWWNADIAVMKHFPVTEESQIQFRAEFFNLFNNVNFGNPNSSLTSSTFGRITGQNGDPRIIQFALKFFF